MQEELNLIFLITLIVRRVIFFYNKFSSTELTYLFLQRKSMTKTRRTIIPATTPMITPKISKYDLHQFRLKSIMFALMALLKEVISLIIKCSTSSFISLNTYIVYRSTFVLLD